MLLPWSTMHACYAHALCTIRSEEHYYWPITLGSLTCPASPAHNRKDSSFHSCSASEDTDAASCMDASYIDASTTALTPLAPLQQYIVRLANLCRHSTVTGLEIYWLRDQYICFPYNQGPFSSGSSRICAANRFGSQPPLRIRNLLSACCIRRCFCVHAGA